MKKFNLFLCGTALLAWFAGPVRAGASPEGDADRSARVNETETIFELVQSDEQFSQLASALETANFTDVVANPGAFTVFAPTNEAFNALYDELGVSGPADIPIGRLKQILLDHITDGALSSDELQPGQTLRGFEGGILRIGENDAGELTVNGVPIAQADIMASNGIIHSVDQVLFPSNDGGDDNDGTIFDIAQNDSRFSLLVAALERANLTDIVDNPGGFTVFAPTNDGFNALFDELGVSGLEEIPIGELTPLLLNHITDGVLLSDELQPGQILNGFRGGALRIGENEAGGLTVNGVPIVQADVMASNGVIHAIDQVLSFSNDDDDDNNEEIRLVLVDAEGNQDVGFLSDGDTIDLAKFPDGFNIRALVDESTDRVTFSLNDTLTRTENVVPFTLFEQEGTNYLGRTPAEGNYQLVVTPEDDDEASLTINFFVKAVPPVGQVTGLVLVDAATNQDVGRLTDGDVINLANFPEGFSGRALLDGPVGSVMFAIDNTTRVENVTVFTLFEQEGNVYLGRSPAPGNYQLVITPYAIDNAAGETGEPLTINFTVVGDEMAREARRFTPVEKPLIADPTRSLTLTTFSNPGADRVVMDVRGLDGQTLLVQVVNPAGRLVDQRQYTVFGTQDLPELDLNRYEPGIYVVSVQVGKLRQQVRVMK